MTHVLNTAYLSSTLINKHLFHCIKCVIQTSRDITEDTWLEHTNINAVSRLPVHVGVPQLVTGDSLFYRQA